MRYFFGTAILLAFSSLPVSFAFQEKANPEQAKKDDDAKLVQGKWRVISAQDNGLPYPKSKIEKMSVLIEKDEIRVIVEGTKSEQGAKFTIDPSTNPKQIDFTKETRENEWSDQLLSKLFRSWKLDSGGKVIPAEDQVQGIYKLEGDTLTLCWRATKEKEILKGRVSNELKVRPSVFQSNLYVGLKSADGTELVQAGVPKSFLADKPVRVAAGKSETVTLPTHLCHTRSSSVCLGFKGAAGWNWLTDDLPLGKYRLSLSYETQQKDSGCWQGTVQTG